MAKPKGSRKSTCKCGANQYGLPGTRRKCNECTTHMVFFLKPKAPKVVKAVKRARKAKRR